MPRFDNLGEDEVLQNFDLGGRYKYSGTPLVDLEEVATEFTLVGVAVDESPSVTRFVKEMEACLVEIVSSCKESSYADNLLLRMVAFSSEVREIHGFRLLDSCKPEDYRGCLSPHGLTALDDAVDNLVGSLGNYADHLKGKDFGRNGVVFVITDGLNNDSESSSAATIRVTLEDIVRRESLESLIVVLIGVNGNVVVGRREVSDDIYHDGWTVNQYLEQFYREAGLTHFIPLPDASPETLAKLAKFVSKSVSAQSQSRGTGAPASISLSI